MAEKCSKCGAEILWLKALPTEKTPKPKFNPINASKTLGGNLVVDLQSSQYRFAKKEELQKAKDRNIPLYTSHYATCPFAADFRRK